MRQLILLPALFFCLPLPAALAQDVPTKVGQCVETTIALLGPRLEGVPESGDAVQYGNEIYGVDYDVVPGLRHSKIGDKVKLCLTSVPEDCPPGDDRGRFYSAHNERTGEDWELPAAEHMCGGA